MKCTAFILTVIFMATYPAFVSPATKNDIVKLESLKETITNEAAKLLHNNGIEVANLPRKTNAELQRLINNLTSQLTNHIHMQHKNEIALDVVCTDLATTLANFIPSALTVVSKKVLPQAVDAFITKLVQEKPVKIEKLPPKLQTEFNQRKKETLALLISDMNADERDYVYVSDLEAVCHKKFDLFLERAKYILISQWGQGAMSALDSLKFVTNTQPFPLQNQKNIGG